MQHVFLIPGFFGFTNLGRLVYFTHVREFLGETLASLGLDARVHAVLTDPTASLRKRAIRLLEAIESDAGGGQDPIHLVGHSTGGLDARLLTSPHTTLSGEGDVAAVARRIRTVVSISTPHRGTAVASFFNTLFGQQLLRLLSLATIYALRFGPLPLSAVLKLGALFMRLDDRIGLRDTVADQLFDQLLGEFTPERRRAIQHLLDDMSRDRTLLGQLTPEGLDLLNTTTADRPGVRYGSVVNATPAPGWGTVRRVGLDPYAQATHALYFALHRISERTSLEHLPELGDEQMAALVRHLGRRPAARENDGIVPVLSQPWGEVIHVARADHLDVIGHFGDLEHDPPHYDWFASGAGFNRPGFEALWGDVARFIVTR